MATEIPGEPITLVVSFAFDDQTPDTSGVMFYWDITGDTLRFVLEGTDGDIERADTFSNYRPVNVGALEAGSYTLLFENGEDEIDTFWFEIEDSVYRLQTNSGNVIYTPTWKPNELRRIFPDMLLVYLGTLPGVYDPRPYLDSLTEGLQGIGATVAHVANGTYSLGPWDWYDAGVNGWLGTADGRFYTFDGDTVQLDSVYKVYIEKEWLGALGVRMGNGFYRLYEPWNEY